MFCLPLSAATFDVEQTPSGDLILQLSLEVDWGRHIVPSNVGGKQYHKLIFPDLPTVTQGNGTAELPFSAHLLAIPKNARVELEIMDAQFETFDDVELPGTDALFKANNLFSSEPAGTGQMESTLPLVDTEYLGIMRGVETHSLRLYPISYDARHQRLLVCTYMKVLVRFIGSGAAKQNLITGKSQFPLHVSFINPQHAHPAKPSAKKTHLNKSTEWYDPSRPWIKITIENDGVFRINSTWLRQRNIKLDEIDPDTFQLFHRGTERPLIVSGQDDGFFNDEDYLLFVGRYRREFAESNIEKNFESIYGRKNVYWLTWGNETGLRFKPKNAEPKSAWPESQWFWETAHFEQDLEFQSFPSAPDNKRDHWFRQPIRGNDVDTPGSAIFAEKLPAAHLQEEYVAQLRVALHGQTPAHHTVLKLNNQFVGEYFWEGQDEFLVEEKIPSAFLRDGTNRLLVQAYASDTQGRDVSLFNFFSIDYRRRHDAWPGFLNFSHDKSTGRQVVVSGFSHPNVLLFDTNRDLFFFNIQIDSTQIEDGSMVYSATFEDANDIKASYVIVDSMNVRAPSGIVDLPSQLRRNQNGADYLIISHRNFFPAAERLADHRRAQELSVDIVDVDDIYDEFSNGLILRESIRDFISLAYHQWELPPTYILLLGDATFDYRNIYGGGEPSYVPTSYYQARNRGHSPSDYFYALLDGEDLLPDVAVGRLAVESLKEANATVEKIINYDLRIEPGDWRSRVIYLANYHDKEEFTGPSDDLAHNYSEPFGLKSIKIYNPDEKHLPNVTGKAFLDALNDGALLVNFNGHGSAGTMQYIFSLQYSDWDYLSLVANNRRLPLITAFSCLNGMFVNPHTEAIGEVFADLPEGGSIAYISATAQSFASQNNLLSQHLYKQFFTGETLAFGPALNNAKMRVLAAHPSWTASVLTMQLFGDPAQNLALPEKADYQPTNLTVIGELVTDNAVKIEAKIVNNTRATADSLIVLLIADGSTDSDTLYSKQIPPFVGTRSLSFDWPLGAISGEHVIEIHVDAGNSVEEIDENNNFATITVDILSPMIPELLYPPAESVTSADSLMFEAVVETQLNSNARVQFQLSTQSSFPEGYTTLSPLTEIVDGVARFSPAVLQDTTWFWRARIVNGVSSGPWTAVRSVSTIKGATENSKLTKWRQNAPQIATGELTSLDLAEGSLRITSIAAPLRPSSATREDGFTVRDLEGAGILVTDGTYLYAKRWFNDFSTVYPGSDFFTRIGTGLNGTTRARNYGVFGDSTTAGISATYHSDGYIYIENGRAFELERLSIESGHLDTVAVPDGLLEWKYGRIENGHSLITSDGAHVYNVSMSGQSGTRTSWGVRVFDPTDSWQLVREFTSPPTDNAFTFEWTDGILADGERLYFVEFGGQRRVRMVDAVDGHLIDEWTSDQDTTRIISGQYDWINNKTWLGDLFGSGVFRYAGVDIPLSGTAVSTIVGPSEYWNSLSVIGEGALLVDVLVKTEGEWLPLPEFSNLVVGKQIDLSMIDASDYPEIRLRARFGDSVQRQENVAAAGLASWEVTSLHAPDLRMVAAKSENYDRGIMISSTVRNMSPFTVEEAVVDLLYKDVAKPVASLKLPQMKRGKEASVIFELNDPHDVGPLSTRVTIPGRSDANPGDNIIDVSLSEELLQLSARRWPSKEPFLNGDPLRIDEGIVIHASFVESGRISMAIDGIPQQSDSTIVASPDSGLNVLFSPKLTPGNHRMLLQLFSGPDELGSRTFDFLVVDKLMLTSVVVYPSPILDRGNFTYMLSHDAKVSARIFSLNGRLISSVGPELQQAGFGQLKWDGTDENGANLANGSYLYLIEATDGETRTRQTGAFAIFR